MKEDILNKRKGKKGNGDIKVEIIGPVMQDEQSSQDQDVLPMDLPPSSSSSQRSNKIIV
jgi:hypothetical protein